MTTVTRNLPAIAPLSIDLESSMKLYGNGRRAILDRAPTNIEVEWTMARASVLSLSIEDPDYVLLRDSLLATTIDLQLPSTPGTQYIDRWRLDRSRGVGGISTSETGTVLRFWGLPEGALKSRTGVLRKPTERMDLRNFVNFLAREVKDVVGLVGLVPRPNSAPPRETDEAPEEQSVGFSANAARRITVKGEPATPAQLRTMDKVLRRAVAKRAPKLAVWGMVCANIGEASYRERARNPKTDALGLFQLIPSTRSAFGLDPYDVEACADQFLVHGYTKGKRGNYGAIPIAKANPRLTPGTIASRVEGSDQGGAFYDVYQREARQIIELWSGRDLSRWSEVTGAAGSSEDDREPGGSGDVRPSEWTRKAGESSWTALGRYAEPLGRRRFVSANRVILARDQDLILAAPHMSFGLRDPRLLGRPSIDQDGSAKVQAIALKVLSEHWTAPPGAVVDITDAGPATGAWLVETIRARANDPVLDVNLTQPTTVVPGTQSGTPGRRRTPRQREAAASEGAEAAIRWAEQRIGTKEVGQNRGQAVEKIIRDQGGFPGQPWCGYFCRGALRAAGLTPPVNMAVVQWIYNTSGAKGSVFSGRTTPQNAKPGDLVILFGTGQHVGLVVRVNVTRNIVETIEGNTGLPGGGGGVARKERPFSQCVAIAQVKYT